MWPLNVHDYFVFINDEADYDINDDYDYDDYHNNTTSTTNMEIMDVDADSKAAFARYTNDNFTYDKIVDTDFFNAFDDDFNDVDIF